jgi:hypothetical protein
MRRTARDSEAAVLTAESLELERLNQEVARLRADKDALVIANATLQQDLESARAQQKRSSRPLAVSMTEPFSITASRQEDFRRAVNAWNTIIELTGPRGEFLSDVLPATCDSSWELHGWIKFTGRPDWRHYIGLRCFTDTQGLPENEITMMSVYTVAETEAVLAEPCQKNDTVLRMKGESVSSWPSKLKARVPTGEQCHYLETVAFGGNILPNFMTSPAIRQWQMKDDILEVELEAGMDGYWSAGTAVRMHRDGLRQVYGHSAPIENKWTEFKMNHTTHGLRPGTNSVRIMVYYCNMLMGGWSAGLPDTSGCSLQIRDLRWEIAS